MAFRCGAATASGGTCKNHVPNEGSECAWHKALGQECSICMEQMYERNHIELSCNHKFHKKCLRQWRNRNRTCPLCREEFSRPEFRVTVLVEPIEPSSNNAGISMDYSNSIENILRNMDISPDTYTTQIRLEAETEDVSTVRSVLERIGITLTDSDLEQLQGLVR